MPKLAFIKKLWWCRKIDKYEVCESKVNASWEQNPAFGELGPEQIERY